MTVPPVVELTIVGCPVPKGRPRVTRSGRAYTPARTLDAEKVIALRAREAMGALPPLAGHLRVELEFYVPDKRRRDIDNLAKLVFDSCNGVLWLDDSQIRNMVVDLNHDRVCPRTVLRVYMLEELAA